MNFNEYRQHDALALAALVKKGAVSPDTLLELAIARIEALNPTLNAVVHKLYDAARASLKDLPVDAPFAGVPFLVKDLGPEVKDAPRNTGSVGYRNYVSADDNFVVQKMRAAGLVIAGKTNTPEFGLAPFTEPKLFGPSHNPWNTAYSTGGSSGGSAAAVASGMTPLASANDGGGSIRIPASCCGLFGLKPSRGRVSLSPQFGEMWGGAVSEGCVSRSVRDSAAYLDAVSGPDTGEPYLIQKPERPYLQEVAIPPGTLRIAWSLKNTMGTPEHAECRNAMEHTLALLRSEGHRVEEQELPYEPEDLSQSFIFIAAAEAAADLMMLGEHLGRKVSTADVEPETYALYLLGKALSGAEVAYAKRRWNAVCRRVGQFQETYDLVLTPTLPRPPIRIGELRSNATERLLLSVVNSLNLGSAVKATVGQLAQKVYSYIPWTPFANITGQPSMSVPLYWTSAENLPVGMMFTARFGEEALLFRLAGQLERAAPWFEKTPMPGEMAKQVLG